MRISARAACRDELIRVCKRLITDVAAGDVERREDMPVGGREHLIADGAAEPGGDRGIATRMPKFDGRPLVDSTVLDDGSDDDGGDDDERRDGQSILDDRLGTTRTR